MRQFFSIGTAFIVAGTLGSAVVLAQPPQRRGPPPEALQACVSKAQGAACAVTFHDRTLEGTCESHDGEALACRPAHPPGPPPEALAACSSLQEGADCTVTFQEHQMQGQCHTGPDQQLACRPAHGPGGPGGHGGPGGPGGPPPSSR